MRYTQVVYPSGVEYSSVELMFRESREMPEWRFRTAGPRIISGTTTSLPLVAPGHLSLGHSTPLARYNRKTGALVVLAGLGPQEAPQPPVDGTCEACGTRRAQTLYALRDSDTTRWVALACLAREMGAREHHLEDLLDDALTDPQAAADKRVEAIRTAPRHDTTRVLALALLAHQGAPSFEGGSVREYISAALTSDYTQAAISEILLEAEMLRLWALDEYDTEGDFAAALREACALPTVPSALFGLLAHAPRVAEEWHARRRAANDGHDLDADFADGFLAAVGERVTQPGAYVLSTRVLPSGSTLVVLRGRNGHRLGWFATASPDLAVGDLVDITGTVKKHDVFRGTKTTMLTRCRIA